MSRLWRRRRRRRSRLLGTTLVIHALLSGKWATSRTARVRALLSDASLVACGAVAEREALHRFSALARRGGRLTR
jgi:hypothetical protein